MFILNNNVIGHIDQMLILKSIELFNELDFDALHRIIEIGFNRIIPKDEILIHKGEIPDSFFIIINGSVNVFVNEGDEPIAILSHGEIVGELGIFNNTRRTATVKAREETIILEFDKDDFMAFLINNGSVAYSILKTLTSRLENTNMKMLSKMSS